ncbi:MAG: epoxyalkane--coenzyme M transferase, partial [Anaerolineae bacterium]|nr:epoxyalkane--coenzyme M transferase [Anaerolineae bacterium]
HLCWGNYEGPRIFEPQLGDVIGHIVKINASVYSFEAANPRHAHEWKLFETVKLPEGKVLIPGVLESKTNFIEHPELVAERIARFAGIVGKERVIAGTDCGFGTFAGFGKVHPDIAYGKLEALREGARLASERLWS